MSDNTADNASGGGINTSAASSLLVENSIIYYNSADSSGTDQLSPDPSISSSTIVYSCVESLSGGTNVVGSPDFIDHNTNPLLSNFELDESTSPCVDAGDETLIAFDVHNVDDDDDVDERVPDLKLENRVAFDDIDMGAFEIFDPASCPADLGGPAPGDPDMSVDVFDLFVLLANWNTDGPGSDLAPPTNDVDVFDLFVLLEEWGPCNRGVDQVLSDEDCYKEFGYSWSQELEDCLESVAIAEGYLEE